MRPSRTVIFLLALLCSELQLQLCAAQAGPKEATVLIIRHAEKPETGDQLSPDGQKRAAAYADYFTGLELHGSSLTPNVLFATKDSENSSRPRLTLVPLAAKLGLTITTTFANEEYEMLVETLGNDAFTARTILICWHHGKIDNLLRTFGVKPNHLLPEGKWPDHVFNWLIVLHFDKEGQPDHSEAINEMLMPGDEDLDPPRE
jgi:hypothetical protein